MDAPYRSVRSRRDRGVAAARRRPGVSAEASFGATVHRSNVELCAAIGTFRYRDDPAVSVCDFLDVHL